MIIFKGKDGSVAIMQLAPGADKEDAIKKFRDSHSNGFYAEYYENIDKLPLSREFRDAWIFKGNKIVVDDKKAKQIHKERIRQVRNMELEKLDKEQLRNLSDSDKLKEIESKKQELRDLPNTWDSLDWPVSLLGER